MPLRFAHKWFAWLAARRRATLAVVGTLMLAAAALLGVGLVETYRGAVARRDAYEALLALQRLVFTARSAETGQRGYLLTGDPEYLEPYEEAVGRVGGRIATVLAYSPFPPSRAAELVSLVRAKFAELAETVALHRSGRHDAALAVVRAGRGKALMDTIRDLAQEIRDAELARAAAGDRASRRAAAASLGGFAGLAGLSALVCVGLFAAFSREEKARKRAEAAVDRQANWYAAVNRAIPGGIVTTDCDGKVVDWNLAAAGVFGWSFEEIVGQPLVVLVPERYREAHAIGMTRAMVAGRVANPGRAVELPALHKDGREFPAEMFVDIFVVDGAPHSVGIVRDITARRKVDEELARKRAELERSNADLAQFAYIAAHDLREPLRMINTFLDKLQREYSSWYDDTARQYATFVTTNARRLDVMIEELRSYSLVGAPVEVVDVDLPAEYDAVVRSLGDLVDREGGYIKLTTTLPTVHATATHVRSLFQNFLANGLKYHRPRVAPVVVVACEGPCGDDGGPGAGFWHFSIADNGIGIPPEQLPELEKFKLFARLHAREDFEGTGMGLPICKKIVDRYGGRLWIESTFGIGSTFHFTLPGAAR